MGARFGIFGRLGPDRRFASKTRGPAPELDLHVKRPEKKGEFCYVNALGCGIYYQKKRAKHA